MKFFSIILFSVVFILLGFGCSKPLSLEERLAQYEIERTACIEEEKASFNSTINGQKAEWTEYEQNRAEYSCSTVDLANKYYKQDPEGIIELCVRTKNVGNYTSDKGLGGSITDKKLEELHNAGMFSDITIDSSGKVTIGEGTLKKWHDLCQMVIENVVSE
ncbi:MAG: hypothetical protein V1664_05250 [Candidatus Uhrbacteria bacterium]